MPPVPAQIPKPLRIPQSRDSVDDVVDSSAVADDAVTDDIIESAPVPTSPDKPTDIAFPGEAPEELEVTVLIRRRRARVGTW